MDKIKAFLIKLFLLSWVALFAILLICNNNSILMNALYSGLGAAGFTLAGLSYAGSKMKQKNTGKVSAPRTTTTNAVFIYKPFENSFTYKIEYQGNIGYLFEGWNRKYIYRIVDSRVYIGASQKIKYNLRGNYVYRGIERNDPVYRIEGNKIYMGKLGRRPVFEIRDRALR